MKDPRLWISNHNGNVFTVTGTDRYIHELTHLRQREVRVKRLAAASWCAWAVGHDHRVYIFVLASDIPIRVPQTTYENQRWTPFTGFRSSNLLPTDRCAWSDEHGDIYLPKESIRLPSAYWDWEGDWFIDENLQGEICTDTGGWQYAVNFTGRWSSESSWNSCVRKRKWIRFCRFTSTNRWACISDMEVVERRQCIIDIAVGGQMLPGQPPDFLSVWAITNNGQVFVRTGVCRDCPEGIEWKHIPCEVMGIINIACGPTGLVWAITWDGHAFVRTHVSRDAVYGLGWESVPYPEEFTRLMQVSVGRNSVWALSRDGKVWFRQGVNGDKLYWDAKAATGSAWVLMVGEMIHISVSANDQVFALGEDDEDKEIWFRTGITPSELGGKTWQRVILQEDPEVFDIDSPHCLLSSASVRSMESSGDDGSSTPDGFSLSQSSGYATHTPFPRNQTSTPVKPLTESSSLPSELSGKSRERKSIPMTSMKESSSYPCTHVEEESSVSQVQMAANIGEQAETESVVSSSENVCSEERVQSTGGESHNIFSHIAAESISPTLTEPEVVSSSVPARSRGFTVSWQVIENENSTHHSSHSERQNPAENDRTVPMVPVSPTAGKKSKTKHSSHSKQVSTKLGHADEKSNPTKTISSQVGDAERTSQDKDIQNIRVDDSGSNCDQQQTPGEQIENYKVEEATAVGEEEDLNTAVLNSSFHSDNMDSMDSSDVICNFVTDLIDCEENEEGVDNKHDTAAVSASDGAEGDISTDTDCGTVTFQDMHNQSESSDKLPASIPWISMGPSESFGGRASSSATPPSDLDIIPAMLLVAAQPRYAWGWLAAGDFTMENPLSVPWLSVWTGSESSINYNLPKVTKALRENTLQLLRKRNYREFQSFAAYEQAIERTTWVKRAGMKIQWPGGEGNWHDCTLEMEQAMGAVMDGMLTVQFKLKHKPKVIQMALQEIRCVKMSDDHHLSVYTCDPDTTICPLSLQTSSEAELREWMGLLNLANLSLWQLNCPVSPGSVCSLTVPGDIFVHCHAETREKPSEMMWGQLGGHMAVIETTPCGVIWGISFDQTPWVYNSGYGNAINRELSEMSSSLREQVDYRTITVFENQKWYPVVGYCSRGVFLDNFAWTTPKGKFVKSQEDIKLPSSQWQWVSGWTVDFTTAGGVSNDGWQYSTNFNRPYHPQQGLRDSVRRRRWSRKCKLVTHGPWVSVGPPELIDISLQVDPASSPTQPLVIWAIEANGDVLCRNDATLAQPMGKSWIHVNTNSDMPFKSVSVGGRYRVWAVATDGSVWYRAGVTPLTPAGSCWIQVIPPPPGGALLNYISVGGSAVWATDTGGNLWRREEITPTFPEGTRWAFVCNRVHKVSVGPKDQVWVVTDAKFGRHKHSAGAVYRRLGITENTPSGTEWELVIGLGWHYASIRGLMTLDR